MVFFNKKKFIGSISIYAINIYIYIPKMCRFLLFGEHKTSMPDRDRLMMSPIEKWIKYRRFPYKLLFHSMLVAIAWIQVSFYYYFNIYVYI